MRYVRHNVRLLLRFLSLPLVLVVLGGFQKSEQARAPEPPVQNVVTDYVGNRVTAMNKAESTAEAANAAAHQTEQQAQSIQDP